MNEERRKELIEKIEIVAGTFNMSKDGIRYKNLIFSNSKYNLDHLRSLSKNTFEFTKRLNQKINNFLATAEECPTNFNPLEPNEIVLVSKNYLKEISIQQNHRHKFEKTARCDIYFRKKVISEFIKFSIAKKWLEVLNIAGESNS